MRNYKLGYINNIEKKTSKLLSLKFFSMMSKIRNFEIQVKKAHKHNKTTPLVYLSLGQEAVASGIFLQMKNSYLLTQHRGHAPYIAFGGNETKLVDELIGLKSGCCGGKGGSPMIHDIKKKIVGHCGLIGDQVPIANGIALVKKKEKIVCIFGDGAAEEDFVLAALADAATKKLKILFICEDNDLSVLTPTKDRRSWKLVDLVKSLGMKSIDIADNPWVINYWTSKFKHQLPALINIRTCRDTWHVGSGRDNNLEWDRYKITKRSLFNLGLDKEINKIEKIYNKWANNLWQRRLRKL
tara:strand:- start:8363 stop:9253 length:891 start_codon:yes stop_codon:yes gene_type:complete